MWKAGILTISDKAWSGERIDESGPVAKQYIGRLPVEVVISGIVPDDKEIISEKLREWADKDALDLIITSGGTGLSPRDNTPEATLAVIDKLIPGLAELMRIQTMKEKPFSVLSRAVTGSRGKCLIINLPGSTAGVRECLEAVLPVIPHALEILAGKVFEGAHDKGS